ncbi:uncharacterized protein LOC134816599 [Bolinopsis microptera]|uniref:uncharacterized protein LOC134816599 n=1 Tax=Bolinopsis microptera TaxID=2820187 RepID=UPI00307A4EDC
MLLQVVTLVLLWTVCAANEDSTQTRGSEARYHIRGPKHQEAVVGGGSSITCSVANPEEDDTFMMEINGNSWDELEGVWTEAEFSKAVYDYENGTIETRIEGFVESFTKEHDMADIRCYSLKHKGEVSMTIKLQDSLTLTADGTWFEYPWQDVPLELWTSSVVGSDDEIHFEAFETGSSDAHIITRMVIRFSRIPIIYVGRCISDTPLENFPYSNQQVWRFVKNGYQDLTVFCNGVQVAYLNFHEAPDPACSYNLGELEARYIKFNARWDHTDRVTGICEAPLPYQGVAAVRQPPVLNGEEIPLACPEGKTLHGTDRVRCYSPEIHSGETYHFEGGRPVCFSGMTIQCTNTH